MAPGEVLDLVSKTGLDGSGSHSIRHQMVDTAKSLDENPHLDPSTYKNYLLACFTPLTLSSKKTGKIIWSNNTPNGIFYTRPIALIRASESRELIESEFSELLSNIMKTKTRVSTENLVNIMNLVLSFIYFLN